MTAVRTRSLGLGIALGAAVLALRPIGPVEKLLDLATIPSRFGAPLGAPSVMVASARGASSSGSDEKRLAMETAMSVQLERAVLRSAWPDVTPFRPGIQPVPGEVDARFGRSRDVIRVRVHDPSRIRVGQPVVAGDVYIGQVTRVSFREPPRDDPGVLESLMRKLRLASAPARPPQDAVDVALITGADQRVGGLVLEGQDGRPCRLVVGGLAWPPDRIWLAVHTPESRSTLQGRVIVNEPQGLASGFDSLAEGFLLGELQTDYVRREGAGFIHEVKGVDAPLDFASGLNQVLILTRAEKGQRVDLEAGRELASIVPVLGDGGWTPARLLSVGDTNPWRSTYRISVGRTSGAREGAAVVDGVRLLGRVVRPDRLSASVAAVDDPGFQVSVLAQCVDAPEAAPLAMGNLVSEGRAPEGGILFRWSPESGTREPEWMSSRDPGEAIEVVLWTGSGMLRVPRGLRLGRTTLRRPGRPEAAESADESADGATVNEEDPLGSQMADPDSDPSAIKGRGADRPNGVGSPDGQLLVVTEPAQWSADLSVRIGGSRLRRPSVGPGNNPASGVPSLPSPGGPPR